MISTTTSARIASTKSSHQTYGIILILFLVLAVVTRFFGLWQWAYELDEIFTLQDSLSGGYSGSTHPAMYFLVDISLAIFGATEFAARLPAALFGVAGIIGFFLLSRSLLGHWAAVTGTLFLVLNAWHLEQSQFARFYSALFFFATCAYFLHFRALKQGSLKLLFVTLAVCAVGLSFHTTFLIVPFTLFVFSVLAFFIPEFRPSERSQAVAKVHMFIGLGGAILIGLPLAYIVLSNWVSHSQGEIGGWGEGPFHQVLALSKNVGFSLFIAAIAGMVLLFRSYKVLGYYFAINFGIALVFLTVGSLFMDMRPGYIFFSLPLIMAAAGFLGSEFIRGLSSPRLVGFLPSLIIAASLLPEFTSFYTSKMTLDIRDSVRFLQENYQPGDRILAFNPEVHHYLKQNERDYATVPWMGGDFTENWDEKLAPYADGNERLWIVILQHRSRPSESLQTWLFNNSALVFEKQSRRFDYGVDQIRIFRQLAPAFTP